MAPVVAVHILRQGQHPHRLGDVIPVQHRHLPVAAALLVFPVPGIGHLAAVIGEIGQRQGIPAPIVSVEVLNIDRVTAIHRQVGLIIHHDRRLRLCRVVNIEAILPYDTEQRAIVLIRDLLEALIGGILQQRGQMMGLTVVQVKIILVIAVGIIHAKVTHKQPVAAALRKDPACLLIQGNQSAAALLHQDPRRINRHNGNAVVSAGAVQRISVIALRVQVDDHILKVEKRRVLRCDKVLGSISVPLGHLGVFQAGNIQRFRPPVRKMITVLSAVNTHLLLSPAQQAAAFGAAINKNIGIRRVVFGLGGNQFPAGGLRVITRLHLQLALRLWHHHCLAVIVPADVFPAAILLQPYGDGIPAAALVGLGIVRHVLRQEALIAGLGLIQTVPDGQGIPLDRGLPGIGKQVIPQFPRAHPKVAVIVVEILQRGVRHFGAHIKVLLDRGRDLLLRQVEVLRVGQLAAGIVVGVHQLGQLRPLFGIGCAIGGGQVQLLLAGIAVQLIDGIFQQRSGFQLLVAGPVDITHGRQRRQVFPAQGVHIVQVDVVTVFPAVGSAGHQRTGHSRRQQQGRQRQCAPVLFRGIKNGGKAVFQRLFAAVKIGGEQGAAAHAGPHNSQQAPAVFLPVGFIPPGHHGLIAGKLQVPVGGIHHQPHHRVKPVDGIGQHQQQLIPDIPAAVMDQLMPEYQRKLLRRELQLRQQQGRLNGPNDHGAAYGRCINRQRFSQSRRGGFPFQHSQDGFIGQGAAAAGELCSQRQVAAQLPQQEQCGPRCPAPAHRFHHRDRTGTSRGRGDSRLRRFRRFGARPGRGGHPGLDLLVGVVFRRSRHHLDRVSDRGGFSGGGLLPAHRVGELSLGLRQGNYRLRQGDANGQQQPHRDEQPGPVPPLGSKAAAKQRACRQQHRYHQCHRQGQFQQGGHQSFHPCQLLSSPRARRCPAINSSSSARSRSVRSRLSTRDATMRRREDWYIFPKKLRLAQRR